VNGTENLACGGEGTVVPRAKGAMRSAAEKDFFLARECGWRASVDVGGGDYIIGN
jgi:hypothetical protein